MASLLYTARREDLNRGGQRAECLTSPGDTGSNNFSDHFCISQISQATLVARARFALALHLRSTPLVN